MKFMMSMSHWTASSEPMDLSCTVSRDVIEPKDTDLTGTSEYPRADYMEPLDLSTPRTPEMEYYNGPSSFYRSNAGSSGYHPCYRRMPPTTAWNERFPERQNYDSAHYDTYVNRDYGEDPVRTVPKPASYPETESCAQARSWHRPDYSPPYYYQTHPTVTGNSTPSGDCAYYHQCHYENSVSYKDRSSGYNESGTNAPYNSYDPEPRSQTYPGYEVVNDHGTFHDCDNKNKMRTSGGVYSYSNSPISRRSTPDMCQGSRKKSKLKTVIGCKNTGNRLDSYEPFQACAIREIKPLSPACDSHLFISNNRHCAGGFVVKDPVIVHDLEAGQTNPEPIRIPQHLLEGSMNLTNDQEFHSCAQTETHMRDECQQDTCNEDKSVKNHITAFVPHKVIKEEPIIEN